MIAACPADFDGEPEDASGAATTAAAQDLAVQAGGGAATRVLAVQNSSGTMDLYTVPFQRGAQGVNARRTDKGPAEQGDAFAGARKGKGRRRAG